MLLMPKWIVFNGLYVNIVGSYCKVPQAGL